MYVVFRTIREVKRILRGLAGLDFAYAMILNIVLCTELIHARLSTGCDIVEVTPAYDHAEMTSRAATGIMDDFLQML
jgi:arginase family enzyme